MGRFSVPGFPQAMAGTRVQLQAIESLELFDLMERPLTKRGLAVKSVQNDPFQQVTQGQIVVRGKPLEHLEQALFHPYAGLHALNQEPAVLYHDGTNVPR